MQLQAPTTPVKSGRIDVHFPMLKEQQEKRDQEAETPDKKQAPFVRQLVGGRPSGPSDVYAGKLARRAGGRCSQRKELSLELQVHMGKCAVKNVTKYAAGRLKGIVWVQRAFPAAKLQRNSVLLAVEKLKDIE